MVKVAFGFAFKFSSCQETPILASDISRHFREQEAVKDYVTSVRDLTKNFKKISGGLNGGGGQTKKRYYENTTNLMDPSV